jgi:hypothetical protein
VRDAAAALDEEIRAVGSEAVTSKKGGCSVESPSFSFVSCVYSAPLFRSWVACFDRSS